MFQKFIKFFIVLDLILILLLFAFYTWHTFSVLSNMSSGLTPNFFIFRFASRRWNFCG